MADFSKFGGSCPEWDANIECAPTTSACAREDAEELQRSTNKARADLSKSTLQKLKLAELVEWEDHIVPTEDGGSFPIRVYRCRNNKDPKPGYLYFHGGGFLFGSLETEQTDCALLALKAQIVVIHACYRHTPQYPYPTAHEDAWKAFEWVSERLIDIRCNSLIVGGVSAGGNLAASVAYRDSQRLAENREEAEERKRNIAGLTLLTPWLVDHDSYPFGLFASPEVASPVQNASAPLLPKSRIDLFARLLKVTKPLDDLINVGNASKGLINMPKTAVLAAGRDPFRDEALLFAERLRTNGVATKTHIFPGLPHGFRKFTELPSTRRWDELVLECLQWVLSTQDPEAEKKVGSDWIVVEDTSCVDKATACS